MTRSVSGLLILWTNVLKQRCFDMLESGQLLSSFSSFDRKYGVDAYFILEIDQLAFISIV